MFRCCAAKPTDPETKGAIDRFTEHNKEYLKSSKRPTYRYPKKTVKITEDLLEKNALETVSRFKTFNDEYIPKRSKQDEHDSLYYSPGPIKQNVTKVHRTNSLDDVKDTIKRFQLYVEENLLQKGKITIVQKKSLLMDYMKPDWYQELSLDQMNAADNLKSVLTSDIELGNLRNTRATLVSIGLSPVESTKNLKRLIGISNGDDLKFLWFLRELFYKQHNPSTGECYSLNERLILSAICHLSLKFVMTILDTILPPLPSFKEIPKTPRKKKQVCFCQHFSPYIEPLPRPLAPISRQLPRPPRSRPDLTPYFDYHKKKIKSHEPDIGYQESNAVKDSTSINSKIDATYDKKAVFTDLCKSSGINQWSYVYQVLTRSTTCSCMEHCTFHSTNRTVLEQTDLEDIVNISKDEFHDLSTQYIDQTILKIFISNLIQHSSDLKNILLCRCCSSCYDEFEFYLTISKSNEVEVTNKSNEEAATNKPNEKPATKSRGRKKCKRIFKSKCISKCTSKSNTSITSIKEKAVSTNFESLVRDSLFESVPEKNFLIEFDQYLADNDLMLNVCMRDKWQLETQLWYSQKHKHPDEMTDSYIKYINYEPDKINVNNNELMEKLLKSGLYVMRMETNCILTYLPNVHQLPPLKEWLKVRYNHTYTEQYRFKSLMDSYQKWDRFDTRFRIALPDIYDIARYNRLNYDYRECLENQVDLRLKKFHKDLRIAVVNNTRQFWTTLEPYLCDLGIPRKTVFAYLPAREQDLLVYRPWKSHEFIKMC